MSGAPDSVSTEPISRARETPSTTSLRFACSCFRMALRSILFPNRTSEPVIIPNCLPGTPSVVLPPGEQLTDPVELLEQEQSREPVGQRQTRERKELVSLALET